ncbi:MAG: hypothetical protein ACKVP4_09520 [Hyphomicrobium sp.]
MPAGVASTELVAGRSCDDCTMCCKLLAVESIEKPRAVWCPHCNQRRGCRIYDARPGECRAFYCGYRRIDTVDERWKPSKSKFVINYEAELDRIVIHVDPVRPDAWRMAPFYGVFKQWSAKAARDGGMVIVWVGRSATLVYPDRDHDLGAVRDEQVFVPVQRMSASGLRTEFDLVEPDDPRANA